MTHHYGANQILACSSTDAATPAAIYPFIHVAAYRIIICTTCRFACLANETATHLRRRHKLIPVQQRGQIVAAIRQIPNIIQSQTELTDFQLPLLLPSPIPYLEAPIHDGLACMLCPYISRHLQSIQSHCRQQHGWQNPNNRGRPKAEGQSPGVFEVPWRKNVSCQRLFRSRAASGWFEVNTCSMDYQIAKEDNVGVNYASHNEIFAPSECLFDAQSHNTLDSLSETYESLTNMWQIPNLISGLEPSYTCQLPHDNYEVAWRYIGLLS